MTSDTQKLYREIAITNGRMMDLAPSPAFTDAVELLDKMLDLMDNGDMFVSSSYREEQES